MSDLTSVQQRLLEDLFAHWEQHGDGPREVALEIRWRTEKLKLDQTVESLPGLVERIEDYANGPFLRLRLHGFARCARGMPVIDAYLKLLDRAIKRFKANPRAFAEVSKADLREILGTRDPATVDRYSLAVMQGCTEFRGGGPHTDEWSFRVGTRVIRYAGVKTWSDYLRVREQPEQRLAKLGPEHRLLLQAICAYWCKHKSWPRATEFIIDYLPHGNAYILSSQMPHLFRRREELEEPDKEVPFRLTLDAVIEAGNVDSNVLPLLAEIIGAICKLYAESGGRKASIPAEEVADRLPEQPAADVLRVGLLLQFHNHYFGISVDETPQGSWVARPAKECLDFLEWSTFEDLWRNRKRSETMADWMYPIQGVEMNKVQKLEDLKARVRNLKAQGVSFDDRKVDLVENRIVDVIVELFGASSSQARTIQDHKIWKGGYNVGDGPHERQAKFEAGIEETVELLDALKGDLDEVEAAPPVGAPGPKAGSKRVFIVHGQNHGVRDRIDLFLTKDLGLETVVMEAGPHGGRTLPEKFEEMASRCHFAVFILTADDSLKDLKSGKEMKRARQNVLVETGFFWGAIGRRGRVAFLIEADAAMEIPSDLQGLGWIPITADLAETKLRLQKELRAAGLL